MRYVGTLSRFSERSVNVSRTNTNSEKKLESEVDLMSVSEFMARSASVEWTVASDNSARYKVVAVVSGVEPARTVFEVQLRKALSEIPGRHMMILGKPAAGHKTWIEGNIEFHTHLPDDAFAEAIRSADYVVSRGGYSTVMDMAELGAKCIFVPTPGQFEQIVLAHDLSKAGYATQIPADELSSAIRTAC